MKHWRKLVINSRNFWKAIKSRLDFIFAGRKVPKFLTVIFLSFSLRLPYLLTEPNSWKPLAVIKNCHSSRPTLSGYVETTFQLISLSTDSVTCGWFPTNLKLSDLFLLPGLGTSLALTRWRAPQLHCTNRQAPGNQGQSRLMMFAAFQCQIPAKRAPTKLYRLGREEHKSIGGGNHNNILSFPIFVEDWVFSNSMNGCLTLSAGPCWLRRDKQDSFPPR